MSLYQYLQFQSISIGFFFPFTIPCLYIPTSMKRILAPNSINTCTYLLTPVIYL